MFISLLVIVANAFTFSTAESNLCPVSSLINTIYDGQLPYPVELYTPNDPQGGSIAALMKSSTDAIYECSSYADTMYSAATSINIYDNVTIPIRGLHCKHSVCPVVDILVKESLEIMNAWNASFNALCNIDAINSYNQQINKYHLRRLRMEGMNQKVNVVVFGGSMTLGTDVDGVCCLPRSNQTLNGVCANRFEYLNGGALHADKYYCNWFGQFSRWLRVRFPYVEFEFYNLAVGGTGSGVMAKEAFNILKHRQIHLTQNDIVLLDHSANDLHLNSGWNVEHLIREIYRYSKSINVQSHAKSNDYHSERKSTLPSIVIMEILPRSWKKLRYWNETHDVGSYQVAYRAIAEHYKFPLFAYDNLVWSDKVPGYSGMLSKLRSYALHSPWHSHLFIADVFADFVEALISTCPGSNMDENKNVDSKVLPLLPGPTQPQALQDLSEVEKYNCNEKIPYAMDLVASTRFKPSNLSDYEKHLIGWTEYIDFKDVPGFLINDNAPESNRILTKQIDFGYYLSKSHEERQNISMSLQIKYLRTYENAAMVGLFLCGEHLPNLDALWTHFTTMKVSMPEIFTWNWDRSHIEKCLQKPAVEQKIELRYDNEKQMYNRGSKKFKLYNMHLCYL